MDIYTVSFFGHRRVERGTETEKRLDKLLHNLITQREYVDFLIGRDGDFDLLGNCPEINFKLTVAKMPYYEPSQQC